MMTRMDGYSLGDIDRARMAVSTMSPWTQDDRNNIIAMSYSDRPTVRDCPMNRSGRSLRELEIVAAQQPRRRIALACARCRKRKIKCSGDLGNGIGCSNCRNSGADSCNFFRVGSTDYGSIPLGATNCHGFASTPTLNTIPLYGPQPYGCARGYPYSQSQVNLTTKNLPALDWGPGAYDSEPPMEGYGIPTLHGLQNSDSYPVGYVATDGRPWHNTSQRQSINVTDYADQEPATTYAVQSAIVQTMPRHVLALSPDQGVLNTHTLSVHTQMPTQTGRVLPVPNPRPPQQALPSNLQEISTKASALSLNSGTPPNGLPPANPKTSMIWPPSHMGIEGRNNPIPNVTPDLMAPPPSKVSGASTVASDGSLVAYTTVNHSPGSSPPSLGHASTSVQQFPLSRTRNFTTSGLSSGGPMNESYTQESPLYTYSSDNSHKRNHLGDASGPHDALVSGRRYEPLGHHHQSESTSKMTLARRPSLEDRTSPNQHNMTTSTSKQAF